MSWTILLCILLASGFAAAIPWAIAADRADAHLIHRTNCPECEES